MKNSFILLLFVLATASCKNIETETSKLSMDLEIIESSVSSSVADKLTYAEIQHILNEEKWEYQHNKIRSIATAYESLLATIHSEEFSSDDIEVVLAEFSQVIKRIEISNQALNEKLEEKLAYWASVETERFHSGILAIDIRLCVLDIIDELVYQVEKWDVNVNVLKPIIIESSNIVSPGDTYTAKIGLIAYDSTAIPVFRIDSLDLEFLDGFGVYKATTNISGRKTYKGEILLVQNGSVIKHEFEETYLVK